MPFGMMRKMNRTKLALALYFGCLCLILLLADEAEGASLQLPKWNLGQAKHKLRGFIISLKRLAKTDPRVKKVFIFDFFLLVVTSGLPFLLDGVLLNIAMVFCSYFVGIATLLVVPMSALDHPNIVDIDFVDKTCKLSIVAVVGLTLGVIIYVLLKAVDMMQADRAQKAQEEAERRAEAMKTMSATLAEDVLACKHANKELLALLEEGENLHTKTPAEIGGQIGVAIKSLVSFIRLTNKTILSSEAPIQILYERHFLEKDVAIAFNTMDENHKSVLETTAGLLEQYFLQNLEDEEDEEEEEEEEE